MPEAARDERSRSGTQHARVEITFDVLVECAGGGGRNDDSEDEQHGGPERGTRFGHDRDSGERSDADHKPDAQLEQIEKQRDPGVHRRPRWCRPLRCGAAL